MKKISLAIYVVSGMIFTSCEKADQVGDKVEKIELDFLQGFRDGRTEPYLLAKGGNYSCNGVPIAYQFHKTGEVLYLEFGTTYGSDCNGSSNRYQAHAYVYPGFLEKGNYMFEISNCGRTVHGVLSVSENKYTLTKSGGSTVTIPDDPLVCYLTPADAIWGYVFSNPSTAEQNFMDSLYTLGAVPYAPLLENGNYYYYSINSGMPVLNFHVSGTSFLLKSAIDTTSLHSLFNHFAASASIRTGEIQTGTGAYFRL